LLTAKALNRCNGQTVQQFNDLTIHFFDYFRFH